MTFSLLGNLIEGTTGLVVSGMDVAHRTLDDTLDHTGLCAFIPHAVHEVSDGAQGLIRRAVDDFGKTSGSVLRSFDQHTLHGEDKSLGPVIGIGRDVTTPSASSRWRQVCPSAAIGATTTGSRRNGDGAVSMPDLADGLAKRACAA
ncbi:hypothetical protein C8R45DRAFT_1078395 [Mycena sanguinolenta]|nr:hypothetical protein C8R45DRAFT_1078395 [Mycena sanguinolenta]